MNASIMKGFLPLRVATTSWREGVMSALASSEQQVQGLSRRFDAVAKRFERRTHLQIVQLKKKVGSGQDWLEDQITRLKGAELKAETTVEASLIMMHFAQKDAKDLLETYRNRFAKACAKINSLHGKQEKSGDKHSLANGMDGIPIADRRE